MPGARTRTRAPTVNSIKVTASGFIHIRILCERLEYLYGVLTVTPISERGVAEEIGEYVRRENQMGHLGGFQQLRCVEAFLKYLKYQQAQLQSAYHEFGGDRSGASFVIKQIENAFGYFRNPIIGPAQRNLLDE